MAIIKAEKTLKAIESALRVDQGAKFRGLLREAINECADAFNGEQESPFRSHLGASLIGRDCARELWYKFRWVNKSNHIGRIVRLFNRGHLEEGRFVALLKLINCQVWQVDEQGKQFRVSMVGGHFGSAIDAVVKGCPDIPDEPIIGEFKTHGDKSFQKLKKVGVREAKLEHFIQMTIYMGYYRLRWALYLAVNKNDDELYAEIVEFDQGIYNAYTQRGEYIVLSPTPPEKLNNSPAFFTCKMCDHREVCHKGYSPERNCRTCKFSVPVRDGTWGCTFHSALINKEIQLKACDNWTLLEEIINVSNAGLSEIS